MGLQEAQIEQQQRAANGNHSAFKNVGAKIGVHSLNALRTVGMHFDGFAARHSDFMNVASATAFVAGGVMTPGITAASIAAHSVLSLDRVKSKMTYAFDTSMKVIGVDAVSRKDLARIAAEGTIFGVSGVAAMKLPSAISIAPVIISKVPMAINSGISFGRAFLQNNKVRSPLIFNPQSDQLYCGIPFDAIKLRSPIVRKRHGIVDPTKKPHHSWKDSDILSVKDLNLPVPLTSLEVELVEDWIFYRKSLLDVWESQDISFVSQKIAFLLDKVEEQLRKHMTPGDLAALLKEKRGVEIHGRDGKIFKHDNEWVDAKTSMENAVEAIKKALGDNRTSPEQATLLQERVSQISKMWDKYEKLLEKLDCQPKPKL